METLSCWIKLANSTRINMRCMKQEWMKNILIEHCKKNYKLGWNVLRISWKHKIKSRGMRFMQGITDTYPSCTGPALVCRAMESSLINALVMDSVELRPPSCYKRGISKYPPSLHWPQLCFAKSTNAHSIF